MSAYPRTSDDYRQCVMLWPNGKKVKASVMYTRLDTVDSARAKLAEGKVAWVAPQDVEQVTQETPRQ